MNRELLEDKGLPLLMDLNQFVLEGLEKSNLLNLQKLERFVMKIAADWGGSVTDGYITFMREKDDQGDTFWSAYYAGSKLGAEYGFQKSVQTAISKVVPILIGGPVALGARVGIFVGSTGLTWVASDYTDDAMRDALEWSLKVGEGAQELHSKITNYAFNGKKVKELTFKAKRLGVGVWQLIKGQLLDGLLGRIMPLGLLNMSVPFFGRNPLDDLPKRVHVSGYERSGHAVGSHERSWPDGDISNNLSS